MNKMKHKTKNSIRLQKTINPKLSLTIFCNKINSMLSSLIH